VFFCERVSLRTVSVSAIFLKKIGSGMHSDQKFGQRARGVRYIDAGKKRFRNGIPACARSRKNFWNGVPARSITKIPLVSVVPCMDPDCFRYPLFIDLKEGFLNNVYIIVLLSINSLFKDNNKLDDRC
jgi:hypothetical protein